VVPWLRWLVTDLISCRSGFNPRPIHVGYMVDTVALENICCTNTYFPLSCHSTNATYSFIHPAPRLYNLNLNLIYLLTYLLTPWSTIPFEQLTSFQTVKKFLILQNPKVHYHIHKCPPPVPIVSQFDSFHTLHPTSWRFILILSSHLSLCLASGAL
jgi:hypothetical protein